MKTVQVKFFARSRKSPDFADPAGGNRTGTGLVRPANQEKQGENRSDIDATWNDRAWKNGSHHGARLQRAGHQCVAFDRNTESVRQVASDGATAATSLGDLVKKLQRPRAEPDQLPAEIIQPKEGIVLWLVDPSAAAMLAPQAKRAF
jgi:hypothetical protein